MMNQPRSLFPNKTTLPSATSGLVHRTGLYQKLELGLKHTLVLVSASAGYGKTTLLSSWARESSMPVYWLTLDENDNDPSRFLAYLIEAIAHIPQEFKEDLLAILRSPTNYRFHATEVILSSLFSQTHGHVSRYVLVLDDYHLIQSEEIHKAITFLLEQAPPHLHLVISSRVDPPLPLARLRLNEELCELRNQDLAFTPEESYAFFSLRASQSLSKQAIVKLNHLTEGWVAGMKLIALTLEKSLNPATFIARFDGRNRDIFDYLSEEILGQLEPETQDFLLKTSILKQMSAPLCDAITGGHRAQEILEELERSNLFLLHLDDERRWYRYHHLFSEFLHSQLKKIASQASKQLHRKAALWYEKTGDWSAAIEHYLNAEEYEEVARCISFIGKNALMCGEVITLKGWLKRLPNDLLAHDSDLCLLMAWSLLHTYEVDGIEPYLEKAKNDPEKIHQVLAIRATVLSLKGEDGLELAQKALQGLPKSDSFSYHFVSMLVGMEYVKLGKFQESSGIYEATAKSSYEIGDLFTNVLTLSLLAHNERMLGNLDQGLQHAMSAITNAKENRGSLLPVASVAYTVLGRIKYEQHALKEAQEYLMEGIRLDRSWENKDNLMVGLMALVRARLANDQPIDDLMREIDEIGSAPKLSNLRSRVRLTKAYAALQAGDLAMVEHWARDISPLEVHEPLLLTNQENRLILADFELAKGLYEEALRIGEFLLSHGRSKANLRTTLNGLIMLALGKWQQGEVEAAIAHLKEALPLAQPQSFISPFIERGSPMTALLTEYLKHEDQVFARSILAILKHRIIQNALDRLSEREREVLSLIIQGKTNGEIAEELFVTVGTVKQHIKSIYSKLNITNRAEVIAALPSLPIK